MASSKSCDHLLELLSESIYPIIPPDDNIVGHGTSASPSLVFLLSTRSELCASSSSVATMGLNLSYFSSGTSNFLIARPSSTTLSPSDSSCRDIFVDITKQIANDGDSYLLALRRLSAGSGRFVVNVHLIGLPSQSSLQFISDFEVEDELGEHMLVVWKVHRSLFYWRDCERRTLPLNLIAFAFIDSHVSFSSLLHTFGLDYLLNVFGFSFPHPSWLSFWPWGKFSSIFKPKINLETLLLTSNKRELATYTNVFWGYFVPFLIDRFSRLSQPITFPFKALQSELVASNQAASVFNPPSSEQPVFCFLNGLTDLSAFRDSNVLGLLRSYLLPFVTSEDLAALINRSSDVCVLLLHETTLSELFADFRPDLIVQLFEDQRIREESFIYLLLYAEHEGDVVISNWLRFTLNLRLDCLLQCEGNTYPDETVLAKVKAPFGAAPSPLRGLVDLELQHFALAYSRLRDSLQDLSRLATRRALRSRLNSLTYPPYVALTEYIAQLPIPPHSRSFLSSRGLLNLPVVNTSND